VTISAVRRRTAWVDLACWLAVAVGGILALARWAGFDGGIWPLVLVPAMTPYLAAAALGPVVVCLVVRRWVAAAAALAVLAALVALVAPRGFGAPDPPRGPALRVLAANLKESSADPRSVVAIVRTQHVDVLAVSEVRRNEITGLARAGLGDLLPYSVTNPGETTTGGTALYSRYPLTDGRRTPVTDGFIETGAVLSVPGAVPVDVTAVHYCAPADPTQMACWTYGMGQTPRATPGGPVRLLLGDFNLTIDYGALRTLLGTGYRDAASVVGQGFVTTWPYDGTPAPPVAIDHVLADRRIGVSGFAAYPIRRSDHHAVFAALTLPAA
jgi:endonuclease/exonuclease/phosphatase (EEP) superfamily protein YafD